ncbi:flagellar hook protein [Azospirillum sp. TSH100]|uniref:flagellar hook-associated protein FlgK n=1 Tax=Azospirillum sp. TSH100 TaxID=652764 RepID=UPI000D60585D|nr:flagellar hook-associated protein FlgK [Azospirillum sp. TSH100]PWC82503.1 flagellar hook protein [Azospirillum sp. TSH100]QCG89046.1 flagellar hook-associated protein FlgK [Azospirillum sp. TSH100]
MSSLLSALNSATASLRTVQTNLNLVTNNIAKANDPTRTRHTAQQQIDGSGQTTATYRREIDDALRDQLETLTAREGGTAVQTDYMRDLGSLLRTTGGKPLLNEYASSFQAAWKTLETSPESRVARLQLVQSADRFAGEIRRVSDGVEVLGRSMQSDLRRSVTTVNGLLKEIGALNDTVGALKQGEAALSAADRRDQLIKELNGYIGVRSLARADGRVVLFTKSGMALLDATPASLSVEGNGVTLAGAGHSTPANGHLLDGRIGALVSMLRDGSATTPPIPADGAPTAEIIRKLRSQLDALAKEFTGGTRPGQPPSFRDAYDNAKPAKVGETSSGFFEGNDRFTLSVNRRLLEDKETIKQSALAPTVRALNAVGRRLDADGLTLTDASYGGMASAITGTWMSAAKIVNDQHSQEKAARQLVDERYHAKTGVNLDEEIADLQRLQTAYAASARVMQVVKSMHEALEALIK